MAATIVSDGASWYVQGKADKIVGRFILKQNVTSVEVIAEEQADSGQGCDSFLRNPKTVVHISQAQQTLVHG